MRTIFKSTLVALAVLFGAGDVHLASQMADVGFFTVFPKAEARVGRPMTPVSVAGAARRTTRRSIRRGAYIATIPAGCAYGSYYGYSLYYCGGRYYQRSGGGYVIVYF
jgi:hypothetical protein